LKTIPQIELHAAFGSGDEDTNRIGLGVSISIATCTTGASAALVQGIVLQGAALAVTTLLFVIAAWVLLRGLSQHRLLGGPPKRKDSQSVDTEKAVAQGYRALQTKAYDKWAAGEFQDRQKLDQARDSFLNTILITESRGISAKLGFPVDLAVVRETDTVFKVRRTSVGDLVSRMLRGDEWTRTVSLDEKCHEYARETYPAHFLACNRHYYLIGFSNDDLSDAEGMIESAAAYYQSIYQFFRLTAVLAPPPSLTSQLNRGEA
jgi:hypothetical protein